MSQLRHPLVSRPLPAVPATPGAPDALGERGQLALPVRAGHGRRPARRDDRGLVSAEWAMVIIAAVAIVGVLVSILTSGPIQEVLLELIKKIIGGALTGI